MASRGIIGGGGIIIRKTMSGTRGGMGMLEKLALLLGSAGGVNWGLGGLFQLDLVSLYLGGATTIAGRVAYTLAAMGGIGCLPLLFRGR